MGGWFGLSGAAGTEGEELLTRRKLSCWLLGFRDVVGDLIRSGCMI